MVTSEELTNELAGATIKDPYIISVGYLRKKSTAYFKLYGNRDKSFSYKLSARECDFEFSNVMFCNKVTINPAQGSSLKGLRVEIYNESEVVSRYILENPFESGVLLSPKNFATRIAINAPNRLINKVKLNSIDVDGYTRMDFKSLEDSLNKIDSIREKAEATIESLKEEEVRLAEAEGLHEKKIADLEEKEQEMTESISSLTEENSTLAEKRDKLSSLVESTKLGLSEKQNKLSSLETEVENITYTRKRLIQDINQKEVELKKLNDDRSIMAYEVGEFIRQGNRDALIYICISIIPWFLIAYVAVRLFEGGLDMLDASKGLSSDEMWRLILSRVPIVLLAGTIVVASYEFSKLFIKRIMDFHKEKLTLSRIGIIAKDVSDSAVDDLDIDDAEKYQLRTKLKMDLLKSHLKRDIDVDYDYKIKTSLFDFYRNKMFGKRSGEMRGEPPASQKISNKEVDEAKVG